MDENKKISNIVKKHLKYFKKNNFLSLQANTESYEVCEQLITESIDYMVQTECYELIDFKYLRFTDGREQSKYVQKLEIDEYPMGLLYLFHSKIDSISDICSVLRYIAVALDDIQYPSFFKFYQEELAEMNNFKSKIKFNDLKNFRCEEIEAEFLSKFTEKDYGYEYEVFEPVGSHFKYFVCNKDFVKYNIQKIYSFCVEFFIYLLEKEEFKGDILQRLTNVEALFPFRFNDKDFVRDLIVNNASYAKKLTTEKTMFNFSEEETNEIIKNALRKNPFMYKCINERYQKNPEICKLVINEDIDCLYSIIKYGPVEANLYKEKALELLEEVPNA